jgi:hypothetical protein
MSLQHREERCHGIGKRIPFGRHDVCCQVDGRLHGSLEIQDHDILDLYG